LLVRNKVRAITCPTQATNSSTFAVCLANLGDQLDDYRSVSFYPRNLEVTLSP
jgi:hypothetical protein